MTDATKSLWSRLMENGAGNLSSVGAAKSSCPHERKSCGKAQDKSTPRGPGDGCHSGCPEPKRPLQPEEFCPELGKPTPPRCCFIRMQDPCAPCCCPPPNKCEEECHPGPKREPICGCDLCKKKRCPDGKCCGPKEPSCHKVLRRCNSESQTSEGYSMRLETKAPDSYRHRRHPCEPSIVECRKSDVSLFQFIKRPLDWLLCTPLKIPVPHIEWRSINDSIPEKDHGSCTARSTLSPRKCTKLPSRNDSNSLSRRHCGNPHDSRRSRDTPGNSHSETVCTNFAKECRNCDCGPCRVRRIFEKPCAGGRDAVDRDRRLENGHSDACHCRLCQVRRVLEEPI